MPGRTQLPKFAWKLVHQRASGLLVAGSVLSATTGLHAQESDTGSWSSFQNGGLCSTDSELPTRWSFDRNIAWEAKLEGYGQSTPIVQNRQVISTSTSGPNKESYHLAAYHLDSGEKLWQLDFDNPTPVKNTSYVSRAAPTPAADSSGIYAFFEGGLLVAVSLKGQVSWSRNLIEEYGPVKARHGLASSVEQDDQHIFVWVERGDEPYLLAVQKQTGNTVWKVDGVGATTWSTPRLVRIDDKRVHLVCSASGKIVGFDPASGARLWEFDEIANNTSCTPIPLGNGRFLIGASDGRGEENTGKGAASNGVIQIEEAQDGSWAAKFVWQAKKATSSFGSPVACEGSAYLVNRVGALFRLDIETGKAVSTKRIDAGSTWATPLLANGKLYVFGQKGITSVIDLNSQEEVATNRLWQPPAEAVEGERSFGGPVLYAAAAASPYLILRRGDALFAVEENN